jgi:hypothetical protein
VKYLDSKTLLFQVRKLLQNDLVKLITFLDCGIRPVKHPVTALFHDSLPLAFLLLHLNWQALTTTLDLNPL